MRSWTDNRKGRDRCQALRTDLGACIKSLLRICNKRGDHSAEQATQRRAGAELAHEGLADEKGIDGVLTHQIDIVTRQNAAFGHNNSPARDARQQVQRGLQADFKAAQIAVIDSDEWGFELQGEIEFVAVVHLDQHGKTKALGDGLELAHGWQVKR